MGKVKREISIGSRTIGGGRPIAIQSMTNTVTADIDSTVRQIRVLTAAGCEIIRVTVPDWESAAALGKIKQQINIPIVADIHFDHRLAVASIENGADKIRINPGNIGGREKVA
ncbi:MAG TPA: flavodoxin-dependent (E)-4-hydroxy-3-methylbut-2-enyl-diphosphate synthase, partial [Clostridia bacterium]|nr:flavodoxin-dependent (E)-4-hydroxy-3-methylbut-2-enyl-diphosphate synthase [Clostridia bacterium]